MDTRQILPLDEILQKISDGKTLSKPEQKAVNETLLSIANAYDGKISDVQTLLQAVMTSLSGTGVENQPKEVAEITVEMLTDAKNLTEEQIPKVPEAHDLPKDEKDEFITVTKEEHPVQKAANIAYEETKKSFEQLVDPQMTELYRQLDALKREGKDQFVNSLRADILNSVQSILVAPRKAQVYGAKLVQERQEKAVAKAQERLAAREKKIIDAANKRYVAQKKKLSTRIICKVAPFSRTATRMSSPEAFLAWDKKVNKELAYARAKYGPDISREQAKLSKLIANTQAKQKVVDDYEKKHPQHVKETREARDQRKEFEKTLKRTIGETIVAHAQQSQDRAPESRDVKDTDDHNLGDDDDHIL